MRQQYATTGLGNEVLCHAAKDQFAESRMTIGTRYNNTCTDVGGYRIQLGYHVPALLRHDLGGGNAVT